MHELKTDYIGFVKYSVKDNVIFLHMNSMIGKLCNPQFEFLYPDTDKLSNDQIEYINSVVIATK